MNQSDLTAIMYYRKGKKSKANSPKFYSKYCKLSCSQDWYYGGGTQVWEEEREEKKKKKQRKGVK